MGRDRGREKSQASSTMSEQSLVKGSNSRTMRSWPELKSRVRYQPTEPPRRPRMLAFDIAMLNSQISNACSNFSNLVWIQQSTTKKSHAFDSCQNSGKLKIPYDLLLRAKQERDTIHCWPVVIRPGQKAASRILTPRERPERMIETRRKRNKMTAKN